MCENKRLIGSRIDMDSLTQPANTAGRLPAQRIDAAGHTHVDRRAVLALALPLMANSAVQTIVAQSEGARRYRRSSQAAWTALWGTLCAVPLFVAVGASGHLILAPFGFHPQIEELASAFCFPRVSGAAFGAAVWAMLGFFNGISRPRITVLVTGTMAITNVI